MLRCQAIETINITFNTHEWLKPSRAYFGKWSDSQPMGPGAGRRSNLS